MNPHKQPSQVYKAGVALFGSHDARHGCGHAS